MMTDFEYFDYGDTEDGNKWNWYYVSMYNLESGAPVEESWPVLAQGFDEAMDIYQLLLKATR
jgi:hypothetical protein